MKVEDRTVVTLAYTLRLDNNEIVDEATRQEPFEYVHGAQSIVPGLERALSGLEPGQKRQIVVEPEDGYGEYEEGAIIEVPLTLFPADIEPEVGMGVYLQSADGEPMHFPPQRNGEYDGRLPAKRRRRADAVLHQRGGRGRRFARRQPSLSWRAPAL